MVEMAKPKMKISVPRFDNTELIAQYANTVIGRCMNPPKQEMRNLLFMLPRFWNVEGRFFGSDLGSGRFRFDFDNEEDITEVLKMEPFHFDHWMVSLGRWKPVLEPNYPSKITFWVRVLDVPMQYWVDSTFKSVGNALGLVKGDVDLREGRVRVELDGFKPLVFAMDVNFDEGVELEVNLRYERLVGYCRICGCMTHEHLRCPTKVVEKEVTEMEISKSEQVMSYKGALETGGGSVQSQDGGAEFRNKGKGIVKDRQGPYKEAGAFRQGGAHCVYKDRTNRGYGEGSSRRGGQSNYGAHAVDQRRFAMNTRGLQQLGNRHGDHLDDNQRLMMEAFQGSAKDTEIKKGGQAMVETTVSKGARKSLTFDEAFAFVGLEEPQPIVGNTEGQAVSKSGGTNQTNLAEVKGDTDMGEGGQASLPEDNTLEDEGILLSDSELVDEGWEDGEMADFMEEMEEAAGMEELVVTNTAVAPVSEPQDVGEKLTKKKGTKAGTRLVHKLLSPRKSKTSKPIGKAGEGKKAGNKP